MVGVDNGEATYGTRAQTMNLSSLGTVQNRAQRRVPVDGISDVSAPISKLVVHHIFRYGEAANIYTYRNVRISSIAMSALNMATSDAPEFTFEFNFDSLHITEEYAMDRKAVIEATPGGGLGGIVTLQPSGFSPVAQGVIGSPSAPASSQPKTGDTLYSGAPSYLERGVSNDVTGDAFDYSGDYDELNSITNNPDRYSDIDVLSNATLNEDEEFVIDEDNLTELGNNNVSGINLDRATNITDTGGEPMRLGDEDLFQADADTVDDSFDYTTPGNITYATQTEYVNQRANPDQFGAEGEYEYLDSPKYQGSFNYDKARAEMKQLASSSQDIDRNGSPDYKPGTNLGVYDNSLVAYPPPTTSNQPRYPTVNEFDQILRVARDVSKGKMPSTALVASAVESIVRHAKPVASTNRPVAAPSGVIGGSVARVATTVAKTLGSSSALRGLIPGSPQTQRDVTRTVAALGRLF